MIVVTSHSSGTRVELVCCVCHHRLSLTQAWMAFPADAEGAEGKWVHQNCVKGVVQTLFGQTHAVMMRGSVALVRIVESLEGPVELE